MTQGRGWLALLPAILLVLTQCTEEPVEVIKIQSYSSGEFTLNGQPASIADMRAIVGPTTDRDAVIWYYREAAELEPTNAQLEVLEIIMAARLPISLSTKPDFSDYVGADGNSHPRTSEN